MVLAAPFLHVSFTGADASALPASSSAGTAYELVQSKFTAFSGAPASLVVGAAHPTARDLSSLTAKAAAIPGVKAVSTFAHLGGSLWESNVALSSAPLSPAAQRTVDGLQSLDGPGKVTVVGQTASFLSLQKSLKSHLPVVLGLIVLIALVMLFAMTRSMVLPLMAVVMNIFTIGATFGMLVWAFEWGHLSHLLGFNGPGALQSTSLIIILAVVFGLSTDYGVFLLGTHEEEHDAGATPDQAVALGLDHTGGIISAAAVCLALAMGALVLSRLVFVKELGLGVAFAVVLDATVVRAILVPAVMKLLGPVAWWSPRWAHQAERPVSMPAMPKTPLVPARGLQCRPLGDEVGSRTTHMTNFRPFFNAATGEWIEYTAIAEHNNGELVRFNWRSVPGGMITEHVHPRPGGTFHHRDRGGPFHPGR